MKKSKCNWFEMTSMYMHIWDDCNSDSDDYNNDDKWHDDNDKKLPIIAILFLMIVIIICYFYVPYNYELRNNKNESVKRQLSNIHVNNKMNDEKTDFTFDNKSHDFGTVSGIFWKGNIIGYIYHNKDTNRYELYGRVQLGLGFYSLKRIDKTFKTSKELKTWINNNKRYVRDIIRI
jgi:hypothetical protein